MHIAILQTDNVRDPFRDSHGDYPDMFVRLLTAADQHKALRFSHYDVRCGVPDEVVCDAYLITGSRHSVYEDLPWIAALADFLRHVLDAGKKIVGVCFGHQLMAHFFGGRVAPADVGWGVGVHISTVTPQPWMIEGVGEGAHERQANHCAVLCSHKDQVVQLPDRAQVYLSSDFCPIGGFTLGRQVLTIQGHPEFVKPYAADLMGARRELLGESVYEAGMASLERPTNETSVARWILNFCRDAYD